MIPEPDRELAGGVGLTFLTWAAPSQADNLEAVPA